MIEQYTDAIDEMRELQQKLIHIHPLFKSYYPIIVAVSGTLFIYDHNVNQDRYILIQTVPDDIGIPEQCLAAFPVHHMNRSICAVITPEALMSLEQKVFIYHEFVHCYIYEQGWSVKLRNQLSLARRAQQENNIQWEINYDFPYESTPVACVLKQYLGALTHQDSQKIQHARHALQLILTQEQIDYWIWIEWNEGYARYIENKIRKQLKLETNHDGKEIPYHRLTLYESGSLYIQYLVQQQPNLEYNPDQLFHIMQAERLDFDSK